MRRPAPPATMRKTTTSPSLARAGGATLLSVPVVFIGAQLLVGSAWPTPFSWLHHNVSDLGNLTCGPFGEPSRYVCSPQHEWMNWAFVLAGLLLVVGVGATWARGGTGIVATTTKVLLLLCGSGYLLAGAYPADVDENLHGLGAFLILGPGSGALLAAALARRDSPLGPARGAALLLGTVGALGTWMHLSRTYTFLGMGGTERVAAFALLAWLALVGITLLIRPQGRAGSRDESTPAPQRPSRRLTHRR